MRLSDFIDQNIEPILQEWETFARKTQPEDGDMNVVQLRDHAEEMLREIVLDLETPQTERERREKSKGAGPEEDGETAAETHAQERLRSGFTIDMLVAEYRALRASVLHLWLNRNYRSEAEGEIDDLIRFNEAIDQALAESIARYSKSVQTAQDIFLGIVGHDLRTPLQSIISGADYLIQAPNVGEAVTKLGSRMHYSVTRINTMLDNLLDLTRSRLGRDMQIHPSPTDLAQLSQHVVDEFHSYNPDRDIHNQVGGNCQGHWDSARLAQVYQNLISNALQYGARQEAVSVATHCLRDSVEIRVHNKGRPIPQKDQQKLFNLLHRHSEPSVDAVPGKNLGLGLYIVSEIAKAHQGTVEVASTDKGTTFTVRLPKDT